MRPTKITIISLSLGLLQAVPVTVARADEHTYCPDMRAKQSVLDEAQKYLNDHGGRPPHLISKDFFTQPNYRLIDPGNYEPLVITDSEIDSLPLTTAREIEKATITALSLAKAHQFQLANRLNRRLLPMVEKLGSLPRDLVRLLSDTAYTEIMSTVSAQTLATMPVPRRPSYSSMDDVITNREDEIDENRQFVVQVINNAPASDQAFFTLAESYYDRALSIGQVTFSAGEDITTHLIISAALKEKRKAFHEAENNYALAATRELRAAPYIVSYFLKRKNLRAAKNWQEKLLDSQKHTSQRTYSYLLSVYRHEAPPGDSLALFRQLVNRQIHISADVLTDMFDLIGQEDSEMLSQYLVKTWLVDYFQYKESKNILPLLQALNKNNLSAQTAAVCDEIIEHRGNTIELMAVAAFYSNTNQGQKSLTVYDKIVHSTALSRQTDAEALDCLEKVAKALDDKALHDLPGASKVSSAAAGEIAYHQDQIKRRQCLEMAQKLNDVAFQLESKECFEMAAKSYKEALQIKQSNLQPDDPELGTQLIDLARAETGQKHTTEARKLYEQALTIMRKSTRTDPRSLMSALQNYGQFLKDNKQAGKADTIYAEAREIAKQASIR